MTYLLLVAAHHARDNGTAAIISMLMGLCIVVILLGNRR